MLRHLDTNQCYYSVGSLFNIFLRLTIFFFFFFFLKWKIRLMALTFKIITDTDQAMEQVCVLKQI